MPLPDNFSPAEHLQDVVMLTQNKIVRAEFNDVGDDDWVHDITTPRASLRVACTHVDADSVDMTLIRLWLFYGVLRKAKDFHPDIYGIPATSFQETNKMHPQIHLYFEEKSTEVEHGYSPKSTLLSPNNMGRIQSAAVLERKATLAKARETYYKNKVASTITTVKKRPIDTYLYTSYMLLDSTGNSIKMRVNASAAAVTLFGGFAALGLTEVAGTQKAVGKKPKEFTPAQVHAMKGNATPTASVSPWGTRVLKYSTATSGTSQAHYVAPIAGDTTNTYAEVAARAGVIYASTKGSLGAEDYHRFWFSPEQMNVQEN
jgi:hypothetical protein